MTQAIVSIPDLFAGMNKLEARFAMMLEAQKRSSDIYSWEYEKVTLKLAHDTRYTPDFMVIGRFGAVEFYETKGFMRDDARVKLQTAASMFPYFKFYLVQADLVPTPVKT